MACFAVKDWFVFLGEGPWQAGTQEPHPSEPGSPSLLMHRSPESWSLAMWRVTTYRDQYPIYMFPKGINELNEQFDVSLVNEQSKIYSYCLKSQCILKNLDFQ